MSFEAGLLVHCDVKLAHDLSGLRVVPRESNERSGSLVDALGAALGVTVRLTAQGVAVPAATAPALLSVAEPLRLSWTDEARRFAENRAWVHRAHADVLARVRKTVSDGPAAARASLSDVRGLEALDDHQAVNVAAMVVPGSYGLCVFDEQGAGKTVTAIFGFDALVGRDQADFALIVAPKSMVPEWPRDFRKFKGDVYSVATAVGPREEKTRALRTDVDVLVTNYETCVSMEDELRALLRRRSGRAVLVVDESFFVKNLDAGRTRSIRRLREWCSRAYVLCGTPAPNASTDLLQQFNIVDFGATFDGVAVPDEPGAATAAIAGAVADRGLHVRHLKADVLPDLPGRTFSRVIVPMQPVQAAAYSAALQRHVLDIRRSSAKEFRRNLTTYLAQRTALLQLCSCPETVLDGYTETPGKRIVLDSLLEDLITHKHEKVIVWSFFTAAIEALTKRYGHLGPLRYDGKVADIATRRETVRRFQEDPDARLLVANPAAAGAGLTLHAARIAVFESLSNQPAHYLQSLDRIHRRGQDRDVEYVVLLMENSLEISEYDSLLRKQSTSRNLLGDPEDQALSRDVMLAEAEGAARAIGLAL